MGRVTVEHLDRDRFAIEVRGHLVVVDQPVDAGGTDAGPTPTELLVASLAACVGHYARRYLARHDLPDDDVCVEAEFSMADRPNRVGSVAVTLHLPDGVPAERRAPLLAVASHCTVHNTLDDPPHVRVRLAEAAETAA